MDEQRIIEIEEKLAHQELLLAELNEVLTDQQGQLNRLEQLSRSLGERLEALANASAEDAPADERPPHY